MRTVTTALFGILALTACPGPGGGPDAGDPGDGGFELVTFTPPPASPAGNSVLVTITGEEFATEGVAFPPPAGGGEPYFVDGWEISFEHVIVTVGKVTLSENPALDPQDQSRTGPAVAQAAGPWVVDLALPGQLDSKEDNGKAHALARLTGQNLKSGTPAFSTTERYAFGYELQVPAGRVQDVNLDAEGRTAVATMAEQGLAVWMKGTATFKGTSCRQTVAGYSFDRFPRAVNFTLGFKTPVTFKNCLNPELPEADARGLQTQSGAETVAQVTFHLDHPFWEALIEDAPLRFDAIAAAGTAAAGMGPATFSVTTATVTGKDFQAVRDAQNTPVPWRTCGEALPGERTMGTIVYDPANVPVNPAGGAAGLKDLADFMAYNLSTFGHFNNDGLCFPDRKYPSPP